MAVTLGFYFDQTLCNGCKACQIACKDKHDTAIGVNWRRVAEYSGGTWQITGDTFSPNIFANYLTMACNHCDDAVCVDVCPTTAMHQREDGVVVVDDDLCVGCRYCEWSCPYSAPQYDAETGRMSKCDLCTDYREAGLDPACVAACPSRALDWGPIDELREQYGDVAGIAPLPDPSVTRPNLVIRPHHSAEPVGAATGAITNPREV